jgi:hypothetical protein
MQDSTAVARVVSPGYHFAGDKVLPGPAQVFMGLSQNGGCVYTLHIGIFVWEVMINNSSLGYTVSGILILRQPHISSGYLT